MKKIVWGLVVVVVLILATKQLTASGKTEEPVPEGVFRFYYYPTSNFYYDVAHGNFVYSLDGGRSWEVQPAASPQTARAFKDRKVIDSPVPGVWKYNRDHRRKYGGLLVDYREAESTPAPPAVAAVKEEAPRANKVKKHKEKDWKRRKGDGEEKVDEEPQQDQDKKGLKGFTRGLKEKFRKLGKEE